MLTVLLAVIVASFILVALWRLDLAVIITAAFLPVYLLRLELGGIPFTVLELFVISLAVIFFWRYRLYRLSYLKEALERVPFKLATIIFFLAATLAVLVSPDLRAALGEWRAYFVEAIVYYIIFVNVIRNRKQIKLLLYFLGFSALATSAYAIFQNFTGVGIPDPWRDAELRRVTAWYSYPVAVALFIAPLVGLFSGLLVFAKKSVAAPAWGFSLAVIALGIAAIFFTHSRGALVAIIIGIFGLSFFTKYRWWLVALVSLAIILLLVVPGVSDRFIDVFTGEDNSTNVRLVMWQGTWRLLGDNWLFGAGLSGFPSLYDQYREARHTELLLYPHNLILNFWVEIGIVGLGAFLWLVFLFFRRVFRAYRRGKDKALVLATMTAMIALLVHGLIDVPYFKNDLSILFWIIIGLLSVAMSLPKLPEVNKKGAQTQLTSD